jgi:hypothetical protein
VVPVSAKYQKNVFKVTSTLRHMIEGTRWSSTRQLFRMFFIH